MPENLERWEFGDPADVAERRQAATCAGCHALGHDQTPGFRKYFCKLGKCKAAIALGNMNKCSKYHAGDK
jgi:hypothetical protein